MARPENNIDQLLRLAEPTLRRVVLQRVRGRFSNHRDDIEQTIRLHLWQNLLKYFDPNRGTLEALVAASATQVVNDELQKLSREPNAVPPNHEPLAPSDDSGIERLADEITANPGDFLTEQQARVFNMIADGSGRKSIAQALDIEQDTVSQICWRIKKRIVELAA